MIITNNNALDLINLETGRLLTTTFQERCYRWIFRDYAKLQDQKIAKIFIQNLLEMEPSSDNYKNLYNAAKKFTTNCTHLESATKLKNVVFSKKVSNLLSLNIFSLIDHEGNAKDALLPLLQKNHLHYAIAKVDPRNKTSALIFQDGKPYIRAKEGKSFLHSIHDIDALLQTINVEHPDWTALCELKKCYERGDDASFELKKQLSIGNYSYMPIDQVKLDSSQKIQDHSYLAYGLEIHHPMNWENLKPSFIENGDGKYHFRLMTHLPKYAIEKSRFRAIYQLASNLFNFDQHGHSWVELVAPINKNEKYTGKSHVYSVGYLLRGRLEHIDHRALMPIDQKEINVFDQEISDQTFRKGIKLIEDFQSCLQDSPANRSHRISQLENEDPLKHLASATLFGGTCLTFANTLSQTLSLKTLDYRSSFRKKFISKKISFFSLLPNRIKSIWGTISNAELPYYVLQDKEKKSPV
ncbi:MAG: hypothetical protein KAR79_01600 [Simkaniaceae bacterium]|nr:hypothetical protein [Simkaniaceae bacterium]